jgi:hypothetical protein
MWKVRFFGVDDSGFKFLKILQSDLFSTKSHNINNNQFVEYFIRIVGHGNEEATKILEKAEKELKVYAAFLKINGFEGNLKVDFPSKINDDGTETVYLFLEDTFNITDNYEVSMNEEVVYSSAQEVISNNEIFLRNVLADVTKKELMILLGYEHNWINAYKIYEILRKHFKSEAELKKYEELKYFAHSANSPEAIGIDNARHAVQSHHNPIKIANIETSYNKLIELSLNFIKQNA